MRPIESFIPTSQHRSESNILPAPNEVDLFDSTSSQGELDFGSLYPSSVVKTTIDRKKPQITHRLIEKGRYPDAPDVIRIAWQALVPAIIELSHHVQPDRLTLIQAVRKTKNLKGTGARAAQPGTFSEDGQILDEWLYDVLVPIGTLPIENVEASDRFSTAGAERLISQINEPYDANISAQSRNEAMMCLEMLCTKVWYERNVQMKSAAYIEKSVSSALEFMYWECGIPNSVTLLWDDEPPLWHPIYEQVREFNYRQLYAIERENLVEALIERINRGVLALSERRQYFGRRFLRVERNDVRRSRSFSEQVEIIKAKYVSTAED